MSDDEREKIKAWVDNWKLTGEELDRRKWEELRAMDAPTARRQSSHALAMADSWRASQPNPIHRPSGMVEQQSWFAKWPKKSI